MILLIISAFNSFTVSSIKSRLDGFVPRVNETGKTISNESRI